MPVYCIQMASESENKKSKSESIVEEDVSIGESNTEGTETSDIVEEEDDGIVNHLYELFTNAQGINATEAILTLNDSLDKTNKILYKILNVLNQHLSK